MILVGTGNTHKLAEISSLLSDLPLLVVGTSVLPPGPDVPEEGETFLENARTKALEYARRSAALPQSERPGWVIADDSGLCVDALGGEPGVRSARYAGTDGDHEANIRKLLEALDGVAAEKRAARFVCVIACVRVGSDPDADEPRLAFEVEGVCEGRIGEHRRGKGGFGYDPVFIDPASGKTFAELSPEEKNRRSHRGRALARFRERLLVELGPG